MVDFCRSLNMPWLIMHFIRSTNRYAEFVALGSEPDLYVHASGSDRGHGSSETRHFNDVVTGVSMRPGDRQIWNIHWRGYTHWIITLIDLTGNKINIMFSMVYDEIFSLLFCLARYFFVKFWIRSHPVYVLILFISEVLSVHCHCRVRMSGIWNLRSFCLRNEVLFW